MPAHSGIEGNEKPSELERNFIDPEPIGGLMKCTLRISFKGKEEEQNYWGWMFVGWYTPRNSMETSIAKDQSHSQILAKHATYPHAQLDKLGLDEAEECRFRPEEEKTLDHQISECIAIRKN